MLSRVHERASACVRSCSCSQRNLWDSPGIIGQGKGGYGVERANGDNGEGSKLRLLPKEARP